MNSEVFTRTTSATPRRAISAPDAARPAPRPRSSTGAPPSPRSTGRRARSTGRCRAGAADSASISFFASLSVMRILFRRARRETPENPRSARRAARPRRRMASMILWRAIAFTQGPSFWLRSQVWRLRWIANKVSCTASSTSASPSRARAKRPARHRPHGTADILQQPPVDALVARHRGPHHLRPGIVRRAFDRQERSYGFRSVLAGVTGRMNILLARERG